MNWETKIKKILEDAIPLTPNCEVKRTEEFKRRAALRMAITELVREAEKAKPFNPITEYK